MCWNRLFSIVFTLSLLSCNPVKSNDAFVFTLINGLTTTATNSFLIGSSSKINVTSASVVLYFGTPQLFGFSLVKQPTANVVLSFTNAKLDAIGNLTFTSGNYNFPQLITLDSNTEIMETSILYVNVASADPEFNGISGQIPIYHRNVVITYTGSSFIFKEDNVAPTLTPTLGFPITSCSVLPALPNGLTLNTSTCVISGTPTDPNPLPGSTYTITATDGPNTDTENITISVEPTIYKVFVTASTFNGNLQGAEANGPAGADVKCNADANKPSTGTYKAMVVDGTNRSACSSPNCSGGAGENLFWVFQENSIYVRANDSASLFTPSTAGIIPAPSTILNHNFDSGTTKYFWTGFAMTAYWQEATDEPTNSCVDWTDGSVTAVTTDGGRVGASDSRTYSAFRSGSGRSCSDTYHLLCVEQ
ncbi:Hypothetical protein LBF_0758 [Leptospira biflexa serovar Patoc strain 'Patoc 1 (Ames)']|uniref:DUF1554 domain-containing protein n=1 Tax=Leptospira biflexa serovar Patoc (strain Patoc 1 / ATCC 23582 / Paris) TaxID=456481 RepID=B0SLA6_LEPBP|nr:DUF1554 domain-containing protein [Leptospira biflexa]ABZ93290.1 Hypothetical protein LBF_0758 [Leptospira biflexa serovar Patoc strain 'Patoc 1 (Ames)']ABZ96913.1 Hypothetical protein; putative signal peptide [Leptospira biflexa serovar Patoc strain 'Patoc 1 (Paris)']